MQDGDWNYNQPVDGDERIFMCLVDNDLADGQLAHVAGGIPSKPNEWMMSNLISPYSSTLATHAKSDSGGCDTQLGRAFVKFYEVLTSGKISDENFRTAQVKTAYYFLPF
jgi:hypothetical protein